MSEPELHHRLAAIFSADAVGYTRLLADDESATIRALAFARARIEASVARHHGRVVDAPGDNLLAEFPAALDAVRCSLEVQRVLGDSAAGQPAERRLLYRIGLHLGDIAVDEARIYGDGVNVAARLQTLAEPGGICLSAAIHDSVQGRLDLPFHDLGDQTLKNFPRPVRAFRNGGIAPPATDTPRFELPDHPSIVVLPFANVSGDAEQEYFADGMSEDLIAELARIPGLFVIGRGTSFAYKGKGVAARELGRELGVRHVVEGSVRRSGSRVRITARLSDARGGQEVWSERYDRELGDVFALQDEVVGGIVAELRRALGAGIEHSPRGRPVNPEVWAPMVQVRPRPTAARRRAGMPRASCSCAAPRSIPSLHLVGQSSRAPSACCTSSANRTARISTRVSSTPGVRSSSIPRKRGRTWCSGCCSRCAASATPRSRPRSATCTCSSSASATGASGVPTRRSRNTASAWPTPRTSSARTCSWRRSTRALAR